MDNEILRESMAKSAQREKMSQFAVIDMTMLLGRAMRLFAVSETCNRYQEKLSND
jgi:hypothetical protein